jgi:hypothetical protein
MYFFRVRFTSVRHHGKHIITEWKWIFHSGHHNHTHARSLADNEKQPALNEKVERVELYQSSTGNYL